MKRILGLDLGSKTLGIAVSDPMRIIATGVENFRFPEKQYEEALKKVQSVIQSYDVDEIVIGLPKHMNGDLGESAQLVLEFTAKIEEVTKLKVTTLDERWTTKIATNRLISADLSRNKRKMIIDKMSAIVILQNYLDFKK